jgi:hypothetical protein
LNKGRQTDLGVVEDESSQVGANFKGLDVAFNLE